jgi:tRNA (guanine37-N1)-methyltransferase
MKPRLHVDVFTLFPAMFEGVLGESILKRAKDMGTLRVELHNFRDWATDSHRIVDDYPYGGGGGMVLKPEPLVAAIEAIVPQGEGIPIILLSPQGRLFNQAMASELATHPRLALVCGHYEGVDERVRQLVVSEELSVGDYVLTGGELAAMVVIDAVARLLPGVLGDPDAPAHDSHSSGLLEHPHYTRPATFRGLAVPDVLLSGDHAQVAAWRRQEALRRTWQRRPDLLLTAPLDDEDRRALLQLAQEMVLERREALRA